MKKIAKKIVCLSGFPTLLYFEGGELKFPYPGENNKKSIVDFMMNPIEAPVEKKQGRQIFIFKS